MNNNENEASSKSQNSLIYAFLMKGGRLTSKDAEQRFACARLASRITDIRKLHPDTKIKSDRILLPSNKRVALYYVEQ